MSECVVRMEMPKCCDDCPMNYDGIACRATNRRFYERKGQRVIDCVIDTAEERFPDCPIICSLPEGHGRLIDASYVIDVMQDELDNDVPITVDDCFQIGCKIPTIVPAEAERSET